MELQYQTKSTHLPSSALLYIYCIYCILYIVLKFQMQRMFRAPLSIYSRPLVIYSGLQLFVLSSKTLLPYCLLVKWLPFLIINLAVTFERVFLYFRHNTAVCDIGLTRQRSPVCHMVHYPDSCSIPLGSSPSTSQAVPTHEYRAALAK